MLRAYNLRRRVGLAQKRFDGAKLRRRHQITFVDEDQVGKLDLVAEQVSHCALVPFVALPAAVNEGVHGA